jgi:hypothetical protein
VTTYFVDEAKCKEFGLDAKKVNSIARRLSSAARDAQEIGLCVFGASGSGSLRYHRVEGGAQTEVANLDGSFDGGDGGDSDF